MPKPGIGEFGSAEPVLIVSDAEFDPVAVCAQQQCAVTTTVVVGQCQNGGTIEFKEQTKRSTLRQATQSAGFGPPAGSAAAGVNGPQRQELVHRVLQRQGTVNARQLFAQRRAPGFVTGFDRGHRRRACGAKQRCLVCRCHRWRVRGVGRRRRLGRPASLRCRLDLPVIGDQPERSGDKDGRCGESGNPALLRRPARTAGDFPCGGANQCRIDRALFLAVGAKKGTIANDVHDARNAAGETKRLRGVPRL